MQTNILKIRVVAVLCALLLFMGCSSTCKGQKASIPLKGQISVLKRGDVRVHVYVSPEDSNLNATYAIETKKSLVLVDAQFLVPYAKEFRRYVDSLDKPIDRMIISHSHPDHHWGLSAAFPDVPVYALGDTITAIREKAPGLLARRKPAMGDLAPEKIVVPGHRIEPGTTTIDGVTYVFEEYKDGEDADQLVIKLPDLDIIILQDLVYNKVHLFTAANLTGWIQILEQFQSREGYKTIFAGHGEPTDKTVYAANIAYLKSARALQAGGVRDADDFASRLAAIYPEYRGGLHKLTGSILFASK